MYNTSMTSAPHLYIFFFFSHTHLLSSFWTSRGHRRRPFSPQVLAFNLLSRIGFSNPKARRFFHRVLLTHALALSASQPEHKKKSPRIYTSMHSGGFELTKLTYTRLEDNLIRHRERQASITHNICQVLYTDTTYSRCACVWDMGPGGGMRLRLGLTEL